MAVPPLKARFLVKSDGQISLMSWTTLCIFSSVTARNPVFWENCSKYRLEGIFPRLASGHHRL